MQSKGFLCFCCWGGMGPGIADSVPLSGPTWPRGALAKRFTARYIYSKAIPSGFLNLLVTALELCSMHSKSAPETNSNAQSWVLCALGGRPDEDPAVFKDAFYFVLVSPPPGGPGEGPDCRFPLKIDDCLPVPAWIRRAMCFLLLFLPQAQLGLRLALAHRTKLR
jgi:hypothetical protein